MALRQAAATLAACNSRAWVLGGNQAAQGLGAGLQQERQRDEPASQQVHEFATSAKAHSIVQQFQMNTRTSGLQTPLGSALRQFSTSLLRPHGARAATSGPLGLRGTALMPRASTAISGLTMPGHGVRPQQRNINAWTPAQRYFVEGDHVITAEATRVIQYTGLDSGSFYPFFIYGAIALGLSCVMVGLPFLVAPSRVDMDKTSAYECGFDAFGEARQTFSVSFYLVSIMYLLFDIEIAYLFPYVMSHANATMFWTMNLFLLILVTGFVYEWGVGALEWRDSESDHNTSKRAAW